MGYDTSATQKPKITRKSKAARCTAVLPEQKSVHATKSPQVILCVLPRALRKHGRFSARQNRVWPCQSRVILNFSFQKAVLSFDSSVSSAVARGGNYICTLRGLCDVEDSAAVCRLLHRAEHSVPAVLGSRRDLCLDREAHHKAERYLPPASAFCLSATTARCSTRSSL